MKVTRGMRRQSEKLARRRAALPQNALIAGVDLAKKESVVVFSRADSRARLDRLTIPTDRAGVERLVARGALLRERHGLGPLVVAMEPTSHFWKIVAHALDAQGVGYVLVSGFVVARARELDNLTRDKTDIRDAGLIADLAAELRFTEARLADGPWAELGLLAEARNDRSVERRAALTEQRALLELVWPGLLVACPDLDGSHLQTLLRTGLTPGQVAALPEAQFCELLAAALRPRRFMAKMARRLQAAATDVEPLPGTAAAILRVRLAALRVRAADDAIVELEATMDRLFEETGLGWMRGQIRGLGDATLVSLLGLAGDPRRFDDAGCLVKLAGSNPTERSSGERQAAGGIHRRGRPTLRHVAVQAAVPLVSHNPDFRDRFVALTGRELHKLTPKQAYVAVANKLLRTLWAMAVSGQAYRSEIARGEVRPTPIAA